MHFTPSYSSVCRECVQGEKMIDWRSNRSSKKWPLLSQCTKFKNLIQDITTPATWKKYLIQFILTLKTKVNIMILECFRVFLTLNMEVFWDFWSFLDLQKTWQFLIVRQTQESWLLQNSKAMKSSNLLKPVYMEDPYPRENQDRLLAMM